MNRSLAFFLCISTASLSLFSASANAENVPFTATVLNICTVTPGTPGSMLYDATEYDFNEGTPGAFTVLNTSPNGSVTITPPVDFDDKPGDYAGTPTFSYRYNFVDANEIAEVVVGDGSSAVANFPLPGLNAGTLYSSATTTEGGFTDGAYTAVYTVTCS